MTNKKKTFLEWISTWKTSLWLLLIGAAVYDRDWAVTMGRYLTFPKTSINCSLLELHSLAYCHACGGTPVGSWERGRAVRFPVLLTVVSYLGIVCKQTHAIQYKSLPKWGGNFDIEKFNHVLSFIRADGGSWPCPSSPPPQLLKLNKH